MHSGLKQAGFVVLLAAAVLLAGCGYTSQQTNSYGDSGSTITAMKKLQAGAIGELNSMEWQLIFEDLPSLIEMAASMGIEIPIDSSIELPTLTEEQAKALENFLKENNVMTFNDLAWLAAQIIAGEVEVPEELVEVWDVLVEQLL